MNKYFIQKSSEQLEWFSYELSDEKAVVTMQKYFGCLNQSWGYVATYEYTVYPCGQVKVHLDAKTVQMVSWNRHSCRGWVWCSERIKVCRIPCGMDVAPVKTMRIP